MTQCKHGLSQYSFCLECCRELVAIKNLHKHCKILLAAHEMVHEHELNETMLPAVESVKRKFPEIPCEFLNTLWIGINAKQRSLESEQYHNQRV